MLIFLLSIQKYCEIHCNIRSKEVLSYTAAVNEHEECVVREFNLFGEKSGSLTF